MPAAVFSRKALSSLATLVLGTAAGCGSGLPFDDYTITEGPLSGKMGGAPWTVAWGGVQSSLSTTTDFFAVLYDESGSCDAPPSSDRSRTDQDL